MTKSVSKQTRREVTQALRERYARASRAEKARILDEFVALSGYHRKHAIRVLRRKSLEPWAGRRGGHRVYGEAVREALIVVWEAADRICGKRLKQVLPQFVEAMEQHGHLHLDPGVRARLLSASAATLDRFLSPIRKTAKSRKARPSRTEFSKRVRVRTFADWRNPGPGFLEMDFVAHGGGSMAGVFIHSLVVTDVCTGWTEAIPLLAREQSLVVEALERLHGQIPVPILGVDSDNDSAFINETLVSYCESRKIEFTRSRAYRKNDQAWIEQKNGAVIRRFVGHGRLAGAVAGQTLAHLYHALRLYVNYFQPSFKLKAKTREGSRVKKSYFDPATPCERLLGDERVDEAVKASLRRERAPLDPVELLHRIRGAQSSIVSLSRSEPGGDDRSDGLEEFLAQLPRLWESGEARPTHRKTPGKPRDWRTRSDPFEGVWPQVLEWLEQASDATATVLFERLQAEHPGRFEGGQLRTLQRRLRGWRQVMAKHLVYSCFEGGAHPVEARAVGRGKAHRDDRPDPVSGE